MNEGTHQMEGGGGGVLCNLGSAIYLVEKCSGNNHK